MKYFEIREKLDKNLSCLKFVVERESTAKDICKRYSNLTYEEYDDGQYIFDTSADSIRLCDDSTDKFSGIYKDIKCPHCGASHFKVGSSWSTAMYCPTIIKDGKVISKDHNIVNTEYECLNCGKTFTI